MILAFKMKMGGLYFGHKIQVKLHWCNIIDYRISYRLYVLNSNYIGIRPIGLKFISYSPTDICKLPDLTKWAHLTLFQNWNAGLISKILKTSILATKINKSFSMKYNSHEFRDNIIFYLTSTNIKWRCFMYNRLLFLALLHF